MNNKKNKNLTRGSVTLIAIIIAAVLVIGVGVYMLVKKSSPAQKTAEVDKAIEDIGVSIPDLNFSASPLPDLNISSLNITAPQIPTNNVFSAPSINTDFSYKPNVEISVPTPQFDIKIPSTPSTPKGGETSAPPTGTTQPQVDCSAFVSVPNCSYVGASGSSGYEACKTCYPNK